MLTNGHEHGRASSNCGLDGSVSPPPSPIAALGALGALAFALVLVLWPVPSWAGTAYVCTDAEGRRSIQDSPCRGGSSSDRIRYQQRAPARAATRRSTRNNPGGYGRYRVTQCRSLVEARRALSAAISDLEDEMSAYQPDRLADQSTDASADSPGGRAGYAAELQDLQRRRDRVISRADERCAHVPREYWIEGRHSAAVPRND